MKMVYRPYRGLQGHKTSTVLLTDALPTDFGLSGFYLKVLFWGGSNWGPHSLYERVA